MSLSTDCRAASLEAFLQARAMGSATNAGGGALTGAAGCGRDQDGKFVGGNKCAGEGGYHGLHRAPNPDQGSPAHALEGTFPEDVYSQDSGRLYGHGDPPLDNKTASIIQSLKGNPDAKVRIYRAVPLSTSTSSHVASLEKQKAKILKYGSKAGDYDKVHDELERVKKAAATEPEINPGDWVTVNRDYAKQHGESTLGGKYKIISKVVTAKEIHNDGNSIHEWGYNPRRAKSLDARYASLLAFAESRDCGRDPDGKFSSGNTCASGALAEAAQGAATGAIKGAITGLLAGGPATVKPGAAIGAAVGTVKGIYDNQMRPTRVKRTIESLGMTTDQVGSLVEKLGGTPDSSADTRGSTLRLTIRDKDGKKSFHVEIDKKTITVYPRRPSGELSGREIVRLKKIADESTPKSISVVVKKSSSAYVAKLVKNGFTMAAGHAADVLIANYSTPLVHSVASDVYQSLKKKFS